MIEASGISSEDRHLGLSCFALGFDGARRLCISPFPACIPVAARHNPFHGAQWQLCVVWKLPPMTADLPAKTEHTGGKQQGLDATGIGAFTSFALSMSAICIVAGGITSFHVALCSAGGASIGLGWPLGCLFALVVALTMGQLASAFPRAGGPYEWALKLGGRGWGWLTACFGLAGLVTVLATFHAWSALKTSVALPAAARFRRRGASRCCSRWGCCCRRTP